MPMTFQAGGKDLQRGKRAVTCDLKPLQPRTLALELAKPASTLAPTRSLALDLPWNLDCISDDAHPTDRDFDGVRTLLAGELPAGAQATVWDGCLRGFPLRAWVG